MNAVGRNICKRIVFLALNLYDIIPKIIIIFSDPNALALGLLNIILWVDLLPKRRQATKELNQLSDIVPQNYTIAELLHKKSPRLYFAALKIFIKPFTLIFRTMALSFEHLPSRKLVLYVRAGSLAINVVTRGLKKNTIYYQLKN